MAYCLKALFYIYTRINLNLDLIPNMDFNILYLFGKPITKTSRLQRNFEQIFFGTNAFKEKIAHFQFFLKTHLGVENFRNKYLDF